MTDMADQRELLERLAEEFVRRYRSGERPSLTEYVAAYPEHAAEIRELFPALVVMEELAPSNDNMAGAVVAGPAARPAGLTEQVGDFRLLHEIGRGGMGVVYEAEQLSLDRHVALKLFHLQAGKDDTALERFRREAKAAAQLHHTNIVPVFEVGQDGDACYYAMQLIHGQGLDEVIRELRRLHQGGPAEPGREPLPAGPVAQSLLTGRFQVPQLASPAPSPAAAQQSAVNLEAAAPRAGSIDSTTRLADEPTSSARLPGRPDRPSSGADSRRYYQSVARIGVQAAEALHHAHQRGIVHRDVKPSNLLLDTVGVVWVTDFGLAKTEEGGLTDTGDLVGTIRYMAPERFRGQCDARADVYSLGLTLYELLVLRPAFDDPDRLRLVERIGQQDPPRPRALEPRVPRDLETIVLKATEKEPARRYSSAQELADDLRRFLEDRPVRARRTSAVEQGWRWCRRNPLVAGLLAALVLVFTGGFAAVSWKWREAEQAREQEGQARREADARAERIRRDLEGLQTVYRCLESADLHAHNGRWAAAEADYTQAVQARPDIASPWNERGVFYTRVGLWDLAAADFAESFRLQEPATSYGWQRHAMMRAYVGDITGYRAACARMLEHFRGSADAGAWTQIVDACLYWPGAVPEPAELLPLAERTDGEFLHGAWKLFLLGEAHYRAGHYRQAVGLLRDSLAADPRWQDRIVNYPVLAMAHHRLGQPREARQALDDAARAYEEWIQSLSKLYPDLRSIQWGGWVGFQVHYREARLLLEGAAPDDPRLQLLRARALAAIGKAG
jgi:serine/threonine protein kinase